MKRKIALSLLTVIVIFSVLETGVRYRGFRPGVFFANIREADTLFMTASHYADSLGIWRCIPDSSRGVNRQGFTSPYDFGHDIDSLRTTHQQIVMLVGDSYTEGRSTGDTRQSFASLLDSDAHYAVLNFGIGGGDPLQYELITRRYLTEIKPDVLVICFFLGNDIVFRERKPVPYRPILYETNAGNFILEPSLYTNEEPSDGFRNMQEAYRFQLDKFSLYNRPQIYFRIIAKSALLTRLYYMVYPPYRSLLGSGIKPASALHLRRIISLAHQHHTPVRIIAMPGIEDVKSLHQKEFVEKYSPVFEELSVSFLNIDSLDVTDYISEGNDHFSASGNRKMLHHLKKVLEEK